MARSRFFVCVALVVCAMAVAAEAAHSISVMAINPQGWTRCDPESAIIKSTWKSGTCVPHPARSQDMFSWAQRVDCVSATADSAWTWTFFNDDSCTSTRLDKYRQPVIVHGVGTKCTAGPSAFYSVDCSGGNPIPNEFPVQLLHPTGKCPYTNAGVVTNDACVPLPAQLRPYGDSSYKYMRTTCVQPSANSRVVHSFYKTSDCSYGYSYVQQPYTVERSDCSIVPRFMRLDPVLANCAGPDDHSFDPAPANFTVTLKRANPCPIVHMGYAPNRGCVPFTINGVTRYAQPNCVKPSSLSYYTISIFSDKQCTKKTESHIFYPNEREIACGKAPHISPTLFVEC